MRDGVAARDLDSSLEEERRIGGGGGSASHWHFHGTGEFIRDSFGVSSFGSSAIMCKAKRSNLSSHHCPSPRPAPQHYLQIVYWVLGNNLLLLLIPEAF